MSERRIGSIPCARPVQFLVFQGNLNPPLHVVLQRADNARNNKSRSVSPPEGSNFREGLPAGPI